MQAFYGAAYGIKLQGWAFYNQQVFRASFHLALPRINRADTANYIDASRQFIANNGIGYDFCRIVVGAGVEDYLLHCGKMIDFKNDY